MSRTLSQKNNKTMGHTYSTRYRNMFLKTKVSHSMVGEVKLWYVKITGSYMTEFREAYN